MTAVPEDGLTEPARGLAAPRGFVGASLPGELREAVRRLASAFCEGATS